MLMRALHTLLWMAGVGHIRDTQCGFKLFSRSAGRILFPRQRLSTWMFDVELLMLCRRYEIEVREVDVEWQEIRGSKLNLVKDSIGMFLDLILLKIRYSLFW
jgi:dolichyl-phosphate beta-glucosyltransferase